MESVNSLEENFTDLKSFPLEIMDQPNSNSVGLELIPNSLSGVNFTNTVSQKELQKNRLYEDGSGVAIGDVNQDGWEDIFFASMSGDNRLYLNLGDWRFEDITQLSGLSEPGLFCSGATWMDVDGDSDLDLVLNTTGTGSRLYLNDGQGRFQHAANAGLRNWGGARTSAAADVDRDGDLDLYVAHYRNKSAKDDPVRMRLTQVGGKFEVPLRHRNRFTAETGVDGGVALIELGEPDALYLNDGNGRFTESDWTDGRWLDSQGAPLKESPKDWGLSAMFRDINQDGWPDLYVCNDYYSPDRLWWNLGDGRFREADSGAMTQTSWASMAADFADLDRDGYLDLFTADMAATRHLDRMRQRSNLQTPLLPQLGWGWVPGTATQTVQLMRNTLQHNRGDNTFQEIAFHAGLAATDWTWGAIFLDVDLDGWEDLLIANGHARDWINSDIQNQVADLSRNSAANSNLNVLSQFPPLKQPNLLFQNQGGMKFKETGKEMGWSWSGISNGMAYGDLDNDGDQDLVLNNWNSAALIYKNKSSGSRILVDLKMPDQNTQAVGARLVLEPMHGQLSKKTAKPNLSPQVREVLSGGRYLSASGTSTTFCAHSDLDESWRLKVYWPDGRVSVHENLRSSFRYAVTQTLAVGQSVSKSKNSAEESKSDNSSARVPIFNDETESVGLQFDHQDPTDPVHPSQVLAATHLDRRGPSAVWADLDWDGRIDLVLGNGRGGRMSFWIQRKLDSVKFQQVVPSRPDLNNSPDKAWLVETPADISGTVVVARTQGESTIWSSLLQTETPKGQATPNLAQMKASFNGIDLDGVHQVDPEKALPGALVAADWDLDDELELFVGGMVRQDRFPEPADSFVFASSPTQAFQKENLEGLNLGNLGMVQSAVGTDLNQDGRPELVVAEDWGAIRVFYNQSEGFVEVTEQLGLGQWTGRWRAVIAGDWNGDGLMDLAATNMGTNTPYQRWRDQFSSKAHGLFWRPVNNDANDAVTGPVFEAYQPEGKWVPWNGREDWLKVMPQIVREFSTYEGFGSATVFDLPGVDSNTWSVKLVETLEHSLFLNRGPNAPMERIPLPLETQWAPAYGLVALDADGDGLLDLALAQNDDSLDIEHGRMDGGQGALLLGLGNGEFRFLSSQESGIKLRGPQRALATADFDEDGRSDLLFTVNRGQARLFRNQNSEKGIRVRVLGGSRNPWGIGSKVWLSNTLGERSYTVEIRSGEGWLSQNEPVAVLHWKKSNQPPTQLLCQWPSGLITRVDIPGDKPFPREVRVTQRGRSRLLYAQ